MPSSIGNLISSCRHGRNPAPQGRCEGTPSNSFSSRLAPRRALQFDIELYRGAIKAPPLFNQTITCLHKSQLSSHRELWRRIATWGELTCTLWIMKDRYSKRKELRHPRRHA